MNEREARNLADRALAHIASDESLSAALLAMSGATAAGLRRMAGHPEFAAFILDFILESDERVLGFSEADGGRPEAVAQARHALGGGKEDWP